MTRPALLVLIFCGLAGGADAQSFDCARAKTPVEKSICANPELGDLDSALATKIKRALRAAPAARDALLADERQWVAIRDRECSTRPAPDGPEPPCLKKAYQGRIEAIDHKLPPEQADTAICRRFIEFYRAAVSKDPEAPMRSGDKSFPPNPLEFLTRPEAGAGKISVTTPNGILSQKKELQSWAGHQTPPFTFPTHLLEAFDESVNHEIEIDRLPGTNFFAAHVIAGTGYCYNSHYFAVHNGVVHKAEGPANWDDSKGSSCGVQRYFGFLDGTPAAFEIDESSFAPNLGVTVAITAWRDGRFVPACTVNLAFAPRFDANRPLSHDSGEKSECVGSDCENLRNHALALVEAVQKNPAEAERDALAGLTPEQTAAFVALKNADAVASRHADPPTGPNDIVDTAPLTLPLIYDGVVYRAEIGHQTMGWRIWRDWVVKLKDPDRAAAFYIGMSNGRLIDATVK